MKIFLMNRKGLKFSLPFLLIVFSAFACSRSNSVENMKDNNQGPNNQYISQINNLPKEPLNDAEKSALLFMREEEKLARDVYFALGEKHGANIFQNIYSSEQSHMDALLVLINKYSLSDPVGTNPRGVFQNSDLQKLYDQLIVKGSVSLLEAFTVGATIEDVDIYDLQQTAKNVDNADINFVFNNLINGSQNHMRAFYRNILGAGGTYSAQYITQTELDAILNGK